jgi:hypothetical protein
MMCAAHADDGAAADSREPIVPLLGLQGLSEDSSLLTKVTALRLIAWSLLAAIVLLSVIPAAVRPGTGSHNVEHIAAFLVTGLAFGWSYSNSWGVAIKLGTFAAVVEAVQIIVPGRHARLGDLIMDVAGVFAGVFLASTSRAFSRLIDSSQVR